MQARSSSAAPHRITHPPRHRSATSPRPRLSLAQERFAYAVVAALVVTGVGWLVCHFLLIDASEVGEVPHPAEPTWLALHAAAGMFGLVLFGMLLGPHMQRAWAQHRGRATGGATAGIFVVLALTGYGLYYVGDDGWRDWISVAHWAIGLALPVAVAVHVTRHRTQLRRVPRS